MEDPMPSTYETHTTTTTTHSAGGGIALNKNYIISKEGILRIVEIVLSLITLICGAVGWAVWGYSGWVQFVGAWCFVTILIWFVLYLLGLNVRIPGPAVLIELIYFAVMAVFNFIAGCVAASVGWLSAALGAAAFFAFACMVVLLVDCFFLFQLFRSGVTSATMTSSSHTSQTTTTMTTEKETY